MYDLKPIKIRAVEIIEGDFSRKGARCLARFELEYAGLRFPDWALVRFKNGDTRAFPFRTEKRIVVNVVDPDLHNAITDAAHDAYVAMGGTG